MYVIQDTGAKDIVYTCNHYKHNYYTYNMYICKYKLYIIWYMYMYYTHMYIHISISVNTHTHLLPPLPLSLTGKCELVRQSLVASMKNSIQKAKSFWSLHSDPS